MLFKGKARFSIALSVFPASTWVFDPWRRACAALTGLFFLHLVTGKTRSRSSAPKLTHWTTGANPFPKVRGINGGPND